MAAAKGGGVSGGSGGRTPEQVRNFGNYGDARADAIAKSGVNPGEGKPFVQELGPNKGRVTGMQSADGSSGWRIDFDTRGNNGFHVNWWNGGARGANVITGGSMDAYWEALSHFP